MKTRSVAIGCLIGSVALGTAAAGCGSGGGGGGGGSRSAAVGVISTVSPISSGLNTAALDPQGYTWDEHFFQANQVAGGTIDQIAFAPGISPASSQIVVAHAPLGRIDSFINGTSRGEASLVYEVSSVARISTALLVATGNEGAPAGGDVYLRDSATGGWRLIHDTPYSESVVCALGEDVYCFSGEIGRPGVVSLMSNGVAHFVNDIAIIGSHIPTAAVAYRNEVWAGLSGNSAQGGTASVIRGSGATWTRVLDLGGAGRARVTAMIVVNDLSLIVAVGNFDVATGAPTGGAVYHFDGERLETLVGFSGEAPLALCEQDATVLVGTSRGRLLYRAANGSWLDDPTLPAGVLQIGALATPNIAETLVGVRTATGAHVYRRIANGGGVPLPPPPPTPNPNPNPNPNPQPSGPTYVADVKPVLNACTACHTSTGSANFTTLIFTGNDSSDHQMLTRSTAPVLTNTLDPASSLLITKGRGMSHGGGTVLSQQGADTIVQWIQGGRRLQ
ncbi:MAG: hypothetical protein M9894_14510 [Planctomycetes bacterium]|nr:hypothetical protein [Planctomycetota bacterium]